MTDRDQFLMTININTRKAWEKEAEARPERGTSVSKAIDLLNESAALLSNQHPHLVFADWLDERGEDEQATLIRVDCELSITPDHFRVGRGEDDVVDNLRYFDLAKRSTELRKQLNPFADSVRVKWRFGLIEELECVTPFMHNGLLNAGSDWDAFRLHPVHTLRLNYWHGIDHSLPRNPDALPWLGKLFIPIASYAEPLETIQHHFGRIGGTVCEACEFTGGRETWKPHMPVCSKCNGSGTVGGEWRVDVGFDN